MKICKGIRRWANGLCLAVLVACLAGCAASTQLVRNEHASAEMKAKGLSGYQEIVLIPPKEDKRNVVPQVVAGLQAMGFTVTVADPDKPLDAAQGTGFVVSPDGYVVTCAHVIGDETAATLTLEGTRHEADVVKSDADTDLSLLRMRDTPPGSVPALSFRSAEHDYSLGEDVFTIGFPMSRILGNGARMTKGVLSATTGLRDNPHQVQVSAEIQPGNSGGPLLDHEGQIIGVMAQTMNPWSVAQATGGALPQNVNFSIRNEVVLDFLKAAVPDGGLPLRMNQGGGLEKAVHSVVKVRAGIVQDGETRHRMVVRLFYVSMWDLWYRFRAFVLTAFDYDNQEILFAAGQGHDNLVSNEEVVIKETLAQFRKAVAAK